MELAWETEKRKLALAKLRAHFLDKVEVERIVLHALRAKHYVTTFRTAKFSPEMLAEIAAAKEAAAAAAQKAGDAAALEAAKDAKDAAAKKGADAAATATAPGKPAAGAVPEANSKMTKADLRRLARKRREAEWQVRATNMSPSEHHPLFSPKSLSLLATYPILLFLMYAELLLLVLPCLSDLR